MARLLRVAVAAVVLALLATGFPLPPSVHSLVADAQTSPGGRIAFTWYGIAGALDIFVMNADGSGITNLTNHSGRRPPASVVT